ncbi:RES domain-containing protein [Paraburkholderia sp. SIMBA_054]|uniref:RES domain-containing protein n=1 Tax=Paraburkholderia sp. SIMBA_054 TaxID=3085795 RepID=UPI00397CAAA4
MAAGNDDVLHKVEIVEAEPGTFWHVYDTRYSPVAGNPASKARLAWRDGNHAMFYAADTRAAALWETVLRYASVNRGNVYTDRSHLKDKALVKLQLVAKAEVLDLRTPHRRAIVTTDSDLDGQWDLVLKDPVHKNTHHFTTRVMAQLAAAGYKDGVALRWHSRMSGAETATLFYEPPMKADWWTYKPEDIYLLDTPAGEEQIRQALAEQKLRWVGPPIFKDDPEDGAVDSET